MYQLTLSDAYESVDLYQNGIAVLDYPMRGGQPEKQGDELYGDVTESITVGIDAVSQSAAQDVIRKIGRILDRATANKGKHRANTAWLTLRLDPDSEDWRSELLSGAIAGLNPLDELWKRKLDATFSFTRRPFFEGAEVELPISTSDQGAGTGGRTIHNGAGNSYVQLASSAVPGSLPAPIRIGIQNISGSNRRIGQVWLVNNAHASPSSLDMWMTGSESAGGTGNIGGGTSGTIRWQLDAAFLNAAKGRLVRALLACTTLDSTALAKGTVVVSRAAGATADAWFGPEVETTQDIVDLGVFPLPPGATSGGYDGTSLEVKVTDIDSLSCVVHHIALVPVSSERLLTAVGRISNGTLLWADDSLMDDGIEGETYVLSGTTPFKRYPIALGRGGPLLVFPGLTQRINILFTRETGIYTKGDQSSVRVWMRPRRATI